MTERQAGLNWVNLFAQNLEDLPAFYSGLFRFEEIDYMRNAVFRGFATGGSAIGFMAPDVYEYLGLEQYQQTAGAPFLLNFETGSEQQVRDLVAAALELGARLVKEPYVTAYGWYQAVLTDPEDNVFRINHMLKPAPVST